MSWASVRPRACRSGVRSMPATGVTRSKIMARAASMPKRLPPKAKQSSESCAISLHHLTARSGPQGRVSKGRSAHLVRRPSFETPRGTRLLRMGKVCVHSLRRFGERLQRLDLGGAELELGDLAERIEGGIGQYVGRRLGIAERDKDHAVRYVGIDAHL